MQSILHDRYYNIRILGRYMFQTQSQVKSSGIKLPDIYGVGKSLDPHTQPEKQPIKPIVSKVKEVSQIKPRLGHGRAGLRCKIKTQISKHIAQIVDKPLKIPIIPKTQDKVITIPNFAIPLLEPKGDSSTNMIDRKTIQDVVREIPIFPFQFIDPS